jgi:proteasome lid subunit RPN8/RPN11
MPRTLREGLLREALAILHECGAEKNECVAWLAGPRERPFVLDEVVHPPHSATPVSYQIEDAWLTHFALELTRSGREVRAQIHTHPGPAYHSPTDDAFPAVQVAGFISIVVPYFARTGFDPASFYVAELTENGSWRPGRLQIEALA